MIYMNLLTGEYNRPHRINKWFSAFLDSFTESEYHAQATRLNPWQYNTLMQTVESNNWNMLTPKQWNIFCKYIDFDRAAHEDFSNFLHNGRKYEIRISNDTGFVTIRIY